MAYIGAQPTRGQFRKLSDISGSFNGSTTTFQLSVPPGTAEYYVTPASLYQLLISVGGIIQNPGTDYTISGSQIVFSTAPASGLAFFGVAMGDPLNSNTPSAGSVTGNQLATGLTAVNVSDGTAATPSIQFFGSGTDTGFYSPGADQVAITTGGTERARIDSSGISGSVIATRAEVDGVSTTGSATTGTPTLTVASATGIVANMIVTGTAIPVGTTVSTVVGTTITLSANVTATISSQPVAFFTNSKALTPGSVGSQLCRAWVNFNGTGTVAIRAAYNVSSITDNGTGDYTVNFTSAMTDVNYAVCYAGQRLSSALDYGWTSNYSSTTTSTRIVTLSTNPGTLVDWSAICVAIFR